MNHGIIVVLLTISELAVQSETTSAPPWIPRYLTRAAPPWIPRYLTRESHRRRKTCNAEQILLTPLCKNYPSPLDEAWTECNLACAFNLAQMIQANGCCLTEVWKAAITVKSGENSTARMDSIYEMCQLDDPCGDPSGTESPTFGATDAPQEEEQAPFLPAPADVDPPDPDPTGLEGGNQDLKGIFDTLPRIGAFCGIGFIVIATGCLCVNYCRFRKKQQQIAAYEADRDAERDAEQ
jgi:hypothetical protein